MSKHALLLFSFLISANFLFSQNSGFQLNLRTGFALTDADHDFTTSNEEGTKIGLGNKSTFDVQYTLSNGLLFSAGVGYNHQVYYRSNIYVPSTYSIGGSPNFPSHYTDRRMCFKYLSLPLMTGYHFNLGEKFFLEPKLGSALNFSNGVNEYTSAQSANKRDTEFEAKKHVFSLNSEIYFGVKADDNFSIQFSIGYERFIQPLTSDNSPIKSEAQSFTSRVSIGYNF